MNWEQQTDTKTAYIQTTLFLDLSDDEQSVVSILRQAPEGLQLNEMSITLEKPVSKISSMLLEMEFKGIVKCLPGNVYKIVK
jgi:DNA processing protein